MMNSMSLAGVAAIATAIAAPVAAQYNPYPTPQYNYPAYPGQPYPPQYPQQYPPQYPQQYPGYQQPYGYGRNPVGDIVDQLLGNRYNVSDRQAVRRCANAAASQAAVQYGANGYGGYNGYGNSGYNRAAGYPRVTAITNVERRSYGLRVSGLLSSGGYGRGYGGGYGGGYGYQNGGYGELSFRCNVDYRGAVTGLRVRPAGYRG